MDAYREPSSDASDVQASYQVPGPNEHHNRLCLWHERGSQLHRQRAKFLHVSDIESIAQRKDVFQRRMSVYYSPA